MLKLFGASAFLTVICLAQAKADKSFDQRFADLRLLSSPRVRSELKITPAQLDRMKKIIDGDREKVRKMLLQNRMKAPNSKQMTVQRAQYKQIRDDIKTRQMEVLNPAQMQRLREITIQQAGPAIMRDPSIAMKVGLSTAQRMRIAEESNKFAKYLNKLITETANKVMGRYRGQSVKNAEEGRAIQQAAQKAFAQAQGQIQPTIAAGSASLNRQIFSELSAPQKAKWDALCGRRFVP